MRLWQEGGLPYRPDGRDRRERIARELAGPCSIFLAAEEDGRLVGAVLGTQDGRKGWINRLVVAPSRRRKGVGEALAGIPGTYHRLTFRGHITDCAMSRSLTSAASQPERRNLGAGLPLGESASLDSLKA